MMNEITELDFKEQIGRAAEKAYDIEINKINEQLDKEIIFAMIGEVNSGKSSTINRLMREEVASVGPVPGETIVIDRYVYKGNDKIVFADTPGLNDINQDNSEETEKFFKEVDIILFFLNATGTVLSEQERQVFEKLKEKNKNIILVLNKIDGASDIRTLVKYIKKNTGNEHEVIPISARTGENIDALNAAILDILKETSKDILFARNIKEKSPVANRWIVAASASAGAVGALPIPGSDIVPITAIQISLMVRLASLYDKPLTRDRAKELAITTITGNIGKSVFRQVIKIVPGAGSIAGAGVAGGMTLALGYGVKYAFENNIDLNIETLKHLYNMFKKKENLPKDVE